LAVIIATECVVGVIAFVRQRGRPTPPVAAFSHVDSILRAQIRDLIRQCGTADDWEHLADVYLAYGYFGEAETCYRRAARMAPLRPELAYHWAFAVERFGRTAEANDLYERAVRLGYPHPEDCWYFIGRNWLREENADEARRAFQKSGEQPSAQYELARLLVRYDHAQEAVPSLDHLAAAYPKATQPPLLRYRIEALAGSPLQDVYADRTAQTSDVLPSPWNVEFERLEDVHDQFGVSGEWAACKNLLDKGQYDAAEPRLQRALRAEWDPAGVDLLAKVEARNGRLDEAIHLLQEVVDKSGPSVHFLTRLGDMYEQAGRLDDAKRAWSRAIEQGIPIGAKHREYQYQKLAAAAAKKGYTDASQRYTAQAHYVAGNAAYWDHRIQDALVSLEKAVEMEPSFDHVWFYLGETRRRLGQIEAARQAYQRCLAINPDHGRALASVSLLDPSNK
jgi:tetratricopeptide (TPR) repeat protein